MLPLGRSLLDGPQSQPGLEDNMKRLATRALDLKAARVCSVLSLLLILHVSAGNVPALAQPPSTQFVFNVLDVSFSPIATTISTETFHPSGVATGTWVTFVPVGGSTINSSGRLMAHHSSTGLVAEVTQLVGTTGHGRLVLDGLTGQGELSYTAQGGVRGTVPFEAFLAGPQAYNVHLLGPVPPIFFSN
jgi:hypothetical protein